MWQLVKPITGVTNTVIIPTDGMITVSKPDNVEVLAYVDGKLTTPVDKFWGPAGKPVYFEIKDAPGVTGTVTINYGDTVSKIEVPKGIETSGTSTLTKDIRKDNMAEILNPSGMMMTGGDGGLGFGGGGLIGGLILGSLLRNNGNLFGNDGAGAGALGATLRNPPEQNQANMDLMAGIGAVDKAVAVSTAAMEASQATQTIGITSQLNNTTASLANRVDGVKDTVNAMAMVLAQQLNGVEKSIMENRYELSKDISNDGEKTRALLTQQYEINLQRQLADANAAIIELRGDNRLAERTRGIEVTTTNNINQMQQQQQQQAQYGQLYGALWSLGQSIRDNNSAINVGSGTQTSTNTPTNTNIR
jgi:hypothetical protein